MYNCGRLTFPESMSSRCAADAAFTRADVAAAMDLAASKITSSKFHEASGVSYTQTTCGKLFCKTIKNIIFNQSHTHIDAITVQQYY